MHFHYLKLNFNGEYLRKLIELNDIYFSFHDGRIIRSLILIWLNLLIFKCLFQIFSILWYNWWKGTRIYSLERKLKVEAAPFSASLPPRKRKHGGLIYPRGSRISSFHSLFLSARIYPAQSWWFNRVESQRFLASIPARKKKWNNFCFAPIFKWNSLDLGKRERRKIKKLAYLN